MVQLKVIFESIDNAINPISIPNGSIKSIIYDPFMGSGTTFQFLMVQLKETLQYKAVYVGLEFQFLMVQLNSYIRLYFNS